MPGQQNAEGALSVIGAVSPPGGDLNDPVVQATLRVVKVFWSLEDRLAFQRHFPAISWLNSYSLYSEALAPALARLASAGFTADSARAMALLQKEAELEEIVRLVGRDTLSAADRLTLEAARAIREDFLHQNAFHEVDTYASLAKQAAMLAAILRFHDLARAALERGVAIADIEALPGLDRLGRVKYLEETVTGAGIGDALAQLEGELHELDRLSQERGRHD
jgi:V/A-type H+-transporting ATPase subunit A